ncbi:MAG: Na+/H+ antiporter NhaC [Verrucomicrobia bacterium]|nr:Na+/H+ antiporter NhaC [Verrucomicrobiota bacterium]
MPDVPQKQTTFLQALFPVVGLVVILVYGLIFRPIIQGVEAMPLEIIFLSAGILAIGQLVYLGFPWGEIQTSFINKLARAFPTILILFAIGMIIGSWIAAGTIPMLVYYGIKIINPDYLYVIAFVVAAIFSTFTGTSWGSAGTVGLVLMGVAISVNANLAISAGAIIGGAYFGDKMSPLSDTTNVAALAVEVPLFEHIHSMMYTTIPSAIMAGTLYFVMGLVYPIEASTATASQTDVILGGIQSMFNFNILLVLPVIIVLYGSIKRMPTLPVLVISSFTAGILSILFQQTTFGDAVQALYKGYDTSMAIWMTEKPEVLSTLFNRGGLYELSEPIIITIIVFIYVGTIDKINAMSIIVERVFGFAKTKSSTILASLASTAVINSITSNQYAASFVVGEAFQKTYDKKEIPRKVLSRSLEDAGTMLESLVPWTTTAIFMGATLGVPAVQYWHWQFLSLINIVVAVILAITGIGCFYHTMGGSKNTTETSQNPS